MIAADLRARLVEVESEHLQQFTAHQRSLFAVARQALSASVDELVQELLSPLAGERALYRLATRLLEKTQALALRILGPGALSIHLGEHIAYGDGIRSWHRGWQSYPSICFETQPGLVLYRAGAALKGEALPCVSSSRYQFLSADEQPLSLQCCLAGLT